LRSIGFSHCRTSALQRVRAFAERVRAFAERERLSEHRLETQCASTRASTLHLT
jgi:hypothetical protein